MRRLMGVMVGIALISTGVLFAQTKTIPGDKRTITGTVEAIQADTRELTLKGPKGNYVTVTVPPEVKRFSEIKVGDTISATYYENLVLRVKRPGEKVEDSEQAALTRSSGSPGATAAAQRTITATITEIDMAVPSITFSGPNNWKYSSKVVDKKALASVKVGDKVDITWTEAVLISVQPPEKKK